MKHKKILFCIWSLFPLLINANEITTIETITVVPVSNQEKSLNENSILPSTSTLDTSSSQVILNIQELSGVAGSQGDPLNAVKALPGVVSASAGGGRTPGFYIRGSNANENAIYIDDMPVGYIYHFGGVFSVINADLIDNFSTYLGGFGVEYGDQLGGVVEVNTRRPNNTEIEQSYQVGFYDSSARVEGPIGEQGSGYFAIRRSYIDLLLPTTGKLDPDSENTYTQFPQFWDLQAKYRHELSNGFADVSLFAADDQLRFQIKDEEQSVRDPALIGDLGSKRSFQTVGFRIYNDLDSNLEQKLRFGLVRQTNQFTIGTQQSYDPNPGESYGFNIISDNYFLLPKWKFTDQENEWVVGADLNYNLFEIDGIIFSPCREGQANCSVTESNAVDVGQKVSLYGADAYIELNRPINDRTYLQAGLRSTNYDYAKRPYSEVSPRVNLEYDYNDNTILTASWGRYVQVPQGNEISDSLGNPELVMTEAEHRVIGVKTEWNPLWSSQVEIFQKPMKKLVISRPAPENFSNGGTGEARGFDLLLKRKLRDRQFGWVSYSYLESKRTDADGNSDRLFDGDVPHTVNIVWSQPFTGSWSNWTWGANLKVQSGTPYTEVVGRSQKSATNRGQACNTSDPNDICYWSPEYGKTNGKRLPVSTRLDLSMEKTIKRNKWDLQLRFELINVSALFYPDGNVSDLEYEADYSDYENPKKVAGFPFLPSFSIRGTF